MPECSCPQLWLSEWHGPGERIGNRARRMCHRYRHRVAIAIIWPEFSSLAARDNLTKAAIFLGGGTLCFLLLYGFVISTQVFEAKVSPKKNNVRSRRRSAVSLSLRKQDGSHGMPKSIERFLREQRIIMTLCGRDLGEQFGVDPSADRRPRCATCRVRGNGTRCVERASRATTPQRTGTAPRSSSRSSYVGLQVDLRRAEIAALRVGDLHSTGGRSEALGT